MGWSFGQKPGDREAALKRLCTWTDAAGERRVLKSRIVGSTFYAAVEQTKPDGTRSVYAIVILTKMLRYEWGYKGMDETMGPTQAECPMSIINLLTPTDSQFTNEWRERCRINAQRRRSKPSAGMTVRFGDRSFRLDRPAGRCRGWYATDEFGNGWRLTARHLAAALRA